MRGTSLSVGPWVFSYWPEYDYDGVRTIWLTTPGPTYSVEAYLPDKLPDELRPLAEQLGPVGSNVAD